MGGRGVALGRDVFLSLCLGFSLFSDFHVTACRSGLSDASQILKRQNGFPPPIIIIIILTITRFKYVFFSPLVYKPLDLRAAQLAQITAHPSCRSSSGGVFRLKFALILLPFC